MITGSTTVYLPNSDVEMHVDYYYQDGRFNLDVAWIGGDSIDTMALFVKQGDDFITLDEYIEDKLNDDKNLYYENDIKP